MRVLVSRDLEVGVCYTATQWALTFPNLRRHLMCNLLHIILYFLQLMCRLLHIIECIRRSYAFCIIHYTSRFVPSAKEFLCVICSFSTANIPSMPIKHPTTGCRSACYVCSYTDAFSTAVFLNWPANLKCWIVLP
jgi:hypothetical protein